jgi:predicted RNA binding protein YcfA (HicA-like mRNA interferase family)
MADSLRITGISDGVAADLLRLVLANVAVYGDLNRKIGMEYESRADAARLAGILEKAGWDCLREVGSSTRALHDALRVVSVLYGVNSDTARSVWVTPDEVIRLAYEAVCRTRGVYEAVGRIDRLFYDASAVLEKVLEASIKRKGEKL